MTPEQAKELLPVITAFANGVPIEYRPKDGDNWSEVHSPSWRGDFEYRIKRQKVKVGFGALLMEFPNGVPFLSVYASKDAFDSAVRRPYVRRALSPWKEWEEEVSEASR